MFALSLNNNQEEKFMATTEKTASTEKRDDVFVPRGYANDEPNLFVCINGVNYVLPKGKTSNVPVFVKEEVNRSIRAQQKQDENADALLQQANK